MSNTDVAKCLASHPVLASVSYCIDNIIIVNHFSYAVKLWPIARSNKLCTFVRRIVYNVKMCVNCT